MHFTESHEWISLAGPVGTVGITNHAQKELGEIVYIALPKLGQKLKAGEEVCVLESTKAAADIYTPVSGTVIAVNEAVRIDPSLLNSEPEGGGWLFRIELSQPKEVDALLLETDYLALIS